MLMLPIAITPSYMEPPTVLAAPVCAYEILVTGERFDTALLQTSIVRDAALSLDPTTDRRVARERLREFGVLPPNWDQQGADPIDAACLVQAERLLETLAPSTPSPEITPNPNGTLTFDWENEGQFVSLEIGATRYSAFWDKTQNPLMTEGDHGDGLPDLVARALDALYQQSSRTYASYRGATIDAPGPARWLTGLHRG